MSYCAYVCQIKNLRDHPNADRLYVGECFGNTVAVSKTGYYADMIGVYFPTDGQLSLDFCIQNHLLRKLPDGTPDTGYMDPNKRNVTAIKLRGEKSDGLFLPLSCLDYAIPPTGGRAEDVLKLGDTITTFEGLEICTKYIPRGKNTNHGHMTNGNKTRKKKAPVAPLFAEHADTEQLAYNLDAFRPGDDVEITLKMHGTSQRTGYLPTFQKYKRTLWEKITRKTGTPVYDWGSISGTRRTILDNFDEGGFYGSNEFRGEHHKTFEGKLWKGETVYYEVVGFTHTGAPIMAQCSNKKLNDKEFVKQYGETTTFSYGCEPTAKTFTGYNDSAPGYQDQPVEVKIPQNDIYVYRMTMTNEDGNVVEYTPEFMRYRCEQMGVKTVPVLWRGRIPEHPASAEDDTITAGEWIKNVAERFYDGPDPIGKTHVREGVVCRIVNKPKFCAYKHKNFAFKCLEGIVKAEAETPDMEEADGLAE